MSKYKKPVLWLACLIAMLFVFAACDKAANPPPPEDDEPVIVEPDEKLPEDGDKLKTKGEKMAISARNYRNESKIDVDKTSVEMAKIDINLPKTPGETQAQMNINSFYDDVNEGYVNYFEDSIITRADEQYQFAMENTREFRPFTVTGDYLVQCNDSRYLSIIRYSDEYTGGISTKNSVICENFNPSTGALLELKDIFNVGEAQYIKSLTEIIAEQAKSKHDLFENAGELLGAKLDSKSFYISVDDSGAYSLVIIYPPHTIAPAAVGSVDFVVEFSKISQIIK